MIITAVAPPGEHTPSPPPPPPPNQNTGKKNKKRRGGGGEPANTENSMWREVQVLLIDDNASRRHDMKVVLDFVGEATFAAASTDWKSVVGEEPGAHFSCAFLGDVPGVVKLAQALLEWEPSLPIV